MIFDEKANLSATSAAMKIAVLVATERHPKNFVLIIVVAGLDSCLHSLARVINTGCMLYLCLPHRVRRTLG